eukprot:403358259
MSQQPQKSQQNQSNSSNLQVSAVDQQSSTSINVSQLGKPREVTPFAFGAGIGNKNAKESQSKSVEQEVIQKQQSAIPALSIKDQGMKEINVHKNKFVSAVKGLLVKLDDRQKVLTNRYLSCYSSQCESYYSQLTSSEGDKSQQTYFLEDKFNPDVQNKQRVFLHNSNQKLAEDYNACVETCSTDLKEMRFEIEFQMRELQINLNDCFHYCKLDAANTIDCNVRCIRMHHGFLPVIEDKIQGFYDQKINGASTSKLMNKNIWGKEGFQNKIGDEQKFGITSHMNLNNIV